MSSLSSDTTKADASAGASNKEALRRPRMMNREPNAGKNRNRKQFSWQERVGYQATSRITRSMPEGERGGGREKRGSRKSEKRKPGDNKREVGTVPTNERFLGWFYCNIKGLVRELSLGESANLLSLKCLKMLTTTRLMAFLNHFPGHGYTCPHQGSESARRRR
jgi:hypothetical protein